MAWSDIVLHQMHELESLASWASHVQLGKVRDLCRQAKSELKHELDRARDIEAAKGGRDGT